MKALWQQFESLTIIDNVLYRIFETYSGLPIYQCVLPKSLRLAVMKLTHVDAVGHLGVKKTQKQISRRAWWWEWKKDVDIFCKCCVACQKLHQITKTTKTRVFTPHARRTML
jgi:Integrase zinc binding domain